MELKHIDAGALRYQTARDLCPFDRATGFDAQRNRRQPHHHAFNQGLAVAAEGLDAAPDFDLADGLTDLKSYGAIRMSNNPVEDRGADSARIDVEAARTLAERFDWRVDFQLVDGSEIDKADTARAMRSDLDVDAVPVRTLRVSAAS